MPKVTKEDVRLEGDVLKYVDNGVEHSVRYLIAQYREQVEADARKQAVLETVARIRQYHNHGGPHGCLTHLLDALENEVKS